MNFPAFTKNQVANICLNFVMASLKRKVEAERHWYDVGLKRYVYADILEQNLSLNPKWATVKKIVDNTPYKYDASQKRPYCRLADRIINGS